MKYKIFDEILDSNIPLPELQEEVHSPATLYFRSIPTTSWQDFGIEWSHHWRLPNGQISISSGKVKTDYWLRFPQIADFQIVPEQNRLFSYHYPKTPYNTIRHLLLDQVIPRLLSHQGHQIIHASCVKTKNSAIAFCGESGWGKSTIAYFFHTHGYALLTDDCLRLKIENSRVVGIPNYSGARLFQDDLSLFPEKQHTKPVAHYSSKKRLFLTDCTGTTSTPISDIFILRDPTLLPTTSQINISKIYGASAAIELVKNCFPLDVKDKKRMGKQMQKLAKIGDAKNIAIYHLNYPREINLLPEIMKEILLISNTKSTGNQ